MSPPVFAIRRDLDHHRAGAFGGGGRREAEFTAQVEHGDDFAAQVDDAFDVTRHLWHMCRSNEPDDLAHLDDWQPVRLGTEAEGEIFPGE
jgi:hypothetical protein